MKNSDLMHIQINKSGFLLAFFIYCFGLSTAAFAQLPQEKREVPPMEVQPQEQRQVIISYEDEIEKNELPEGILQSVNETYSDYDISEAYRGSDGSYKIRLAKGEEKLALFYNAGGEFLRLEEEKSEDTINDDWR